MAINFFDYCETAYCSEVAYSGGRAEDSLPIQILQRVSIDQSLSSQVNQKITQQDELSFQVNQEINTSEITWVQVLQNIFAQESFSAQVNQNIDTDQKFFVQVLQQVGLSQNASVQVLQKIVKLFSISSQITQETKVSESLNAQVLNSIKGSESLSNQVVLKTIIYQGISSQVLMATDVRQSLSAQVDNKIRTSEAFHLNIWFNGMRHRRIGNYCVWPDYCEDAYCWDEDKINADLFTQVANAIKLTQSFNVQVYQKIGLTNEIKIQVLQRIFKEDSLFSQINNKIKVIDFFSNQVLQKIKLEPHLKTQIHQRVFREDNFHFQVLNLFSFRLSSQVRNVVYNTRRLRVLDEFPSRGTQALGANNWTSSPVQSNPDFSPNNVNTDVPEQIFRSPDGTSSFVELRCDTGLTQGVFLDTLAILNHNLSLGARVFLQGSNDNFVTIDINIPVKVTTTNAYYIAPTLPNAGYRYWKLVILDPANPDGYISIGIVLFGASKIFTMAENFVNPLVTGYRDFKTVMQTEGYTSISNDRALRKFLQLAFEKLDYSLLNYRTLDEVFKTARTSSKVLWIPTPYAPERYAVFGKLAQLPSVQVESNDETGAKDYLTLSIEIDESL
jgi:hypothetical protein